MNKKEQVKQKAMTEFTTPLKKVVSKEEESNTEVNLEINIEEYFKDVKITDLEKNSFLESILFNKPFKYRIELFDGKVKIEFKTLTEDENLEILQDKSLDKIKQGVNISPKEVLLMAKKELVLMINFIELNGTKIELNPYSVDEKMEILNNKIHEQLLNVIYKQVDKFNKLVGYLSYKADCPDFWKTDTDR